MLQIKSLSLFLKLLSKQMLLLKIHVLQVTHGQCQVSRVLKVLIGWRIKQQINSFVLFFSFISYLYLLRLNELIDVFLGCKFLDFNFHYKIQSQNICINFTILEVFTKDMYPNFFFFWNKGLYPKYFCVRNDLVKDMFPYYQKRSK